MNKELIKQIEKMLKKENELTIRYIPSQAEIEYLETKGIIYQVVDVYLPGIVSDGFVTNFCKYTKKNEESEEE